MLKKASCLHYCHSSIDLHDNLYAITTPSMREVFLDPAFSLVSRAALKSWVWSGVRGEINFALSDSGLVSLGELSVWLPMRSEIHVV